MSVRINVKDIELLERDLKKARIRALPFATNQMLNKSAFKAQTVAKGRVRRELTLRQPFTLKSIQVVKSKTLRISNQYSRVGSTAGYMEDQEFGNTKTAKGRVGVPIPTSEASNQGKAPRRTKLVTKAHKLGAVRLGRSKIRAKSKAQENIIKVKEAVKSGKRRAFLDLGSRKGIFIIKGGKRNPKPRMLYDLSQKSVRTPANPWLRPSMLFASKFMRHEYRLALQYQLRRLGLFNGR
jgi:hypothetical protein